MPQRLLIIYNPTAGRRHRARMQKVLELLESGGANIELELTGARGDAEDFARAAARGQYDAVIAAGGDGTINEVVNGLAGSEMPLGIVPLGTANVLSLELGIRIRPASIAGAILRGRPQPVWPGLINGRRFLLMAGIGFDACVAAGVSINLKRVLGRGAYAVETIRRWAGWKGGDYRVLIDGVEHRAAWVIAARGRLYGGKFVCAANASLFKPELHVLLLERTGRANLARYMAALACGRLGRLCDCRIVIGREVEITDPAGEPVQVDGDASTTLPARIGVDSRPVRVLVE